MDSLWHTYSVVLLFTFVLPLTRSAELILCNVHMKAFETDTFLSCLHPDIYVAGVDHNQRSDTWHPPNHISPDMAESSQLTSHKKQIEQDVSSDMPPTSSVVKREHRRHETQL